jgi:hypothetical protein
VDIDMDIDYEVAFIVAERQLRGRRKVMEYRVRWVGYREQDDTWLTEKALSNAMDALGEWKRRSRNS